MHRLMALVVAGSSLLLQAGCTEDATDPLSGPSVQANRVTLQSGAGETWVEDMTGVVYQITCEPGVQSEPVALSGQIVYRFNVVIDGRGGVHISSSMRPDGLSGVGLDSGEEYRVSEHSHESWTTTPTVANGSWRSRITMTGRQSGQRFTAVNTGHYAVNANGDLVIGRGDSWVECRL
jgi:hypothetical protein